MADFASAFKRTSPAFGATPSPLTRDPALQQAAEMSGQLEDHGLSIHCRVNREHSDVVGKIKY